MAAVDVQLFGAKSLIARLMAAGSFADDLLGMALYREALKIFAVSQRLTPVATGNLKSSGMVTEPHKAPGGGSEVIIGYGGAAAPYAIYVHEITTNKHRPPTQAKFLEAAVMQFSQNFGSDVGKMMSSRIFTLKKGGSL